MSCNSVILSQTPFSKDMSFIFFTLNICNIDVTRVFLVTKFSKFSIKYLIPILLHWQEVGVKFTLVSV